MCRITFENIGIWRRIFRTSLAGMLSLIEAVKNKLNRANNRKPFNRAGTKVSEKTAQKPLYERAHCFEKIQFFQLTLFQIISTNNQRRNFISTCPINSRQINFFSYELSIKHWENNQIGSEGSDWTTCRSLYNPAIERRNTTQRSVFQKIRQIARYWFSLFHFYF